MNKATGLILGVAALALLGSATAARADNAGEVLLENHLLRSAIKKNNYQAQFTLGGSWLNRKDSDEDFSNIDLNFGLAVYHNHWFARADGGFSIDDDRKDGFDIGSSRIQAAGGYQQPFGRNITAGAWIGWGRFENEFRDGDFRTNLGVEGPFAGAGVNYNFTSKGKPSRTSIFLGGRYYFDPSPFGELAMVNADAKDGFEVGGGIRYRFNERFYVTAGATYRKFNIDVPAQIGQNYEDVEPSLNLGVKF
jgi:hypothetical protein